MTTLRPDLLQIAMDFGFSRNRLSKTHPEQVLRELREAGALSNNSRAAPAPPQIPRVKEEERRVPVRAPPTGEVVPRNAQPNGNHLTTLTTTYSQHTHPPPATRPPPSERRSETVQADFTFTRPSLAHSSSHHSPFPVNSSIEQAHASSPFEQHVSVSDSCSSSSSSSPSPCPSSSSSSLAGSGSLLAGRLAFHASEIPTLCATSQGRDCLKRGLQSMIKRLAEITAGVEYHRSWLRGKAAVQMDEEDRVSFRRCQVQPLVDEHREIYTLLQALGVALTEKLAHQRSVEASFSSQHVASSSSFMNEWALKQQELKGLHTVVTRLFQKRD